MGRRSLHARPEQWLCLACLEAPYWARPAGRIFFDVYPQLRDHWRDIHGVPEVADSPSR